MLGVVIRDFAMPKRLITEGGQVRGIELERTRVNGKVEGTGETFRLPADQVFKAIGQTPVDDVLEGTGLERDRGRIRVAADRSTSIEGVWAGGDCVADGEDLTVVAVEDGKVAAEAINAWLGGRS